jgi:hypothetical protein
MLQLHCVKSTKICSISNIVPFGYRYFATACAIYGLQLIFFKAASLCCCSIQFPVLIPLHLIPSMTQLQMCIHIPLNPAPYARVAISTDSVTALQFHRIDDIATCSFPSLCVPWLLRLHHFCYSSVTLIIFH